MHQRKLIYIMLLLGVLPLAYAASPIDLSHLSASTLQSFIGDINNQDINSLKKFRLLNHHTDVNHIKHIRIQQTYLGLDVWGADAVIHLPNSPRLSRATMNGIFYEDIATDIGSKLPPLQSNKALQLAVDAFRQQIGNKLPIEEQNSQLIVYIDELGKAHWAYYLSFFVESAKEGSAPNKPNYIMDAISFHIYQQWDDIQTLKPEQPIYYLGGGHGGNIKMGQLTYDGTSDHLPALQIKRKDRTCSLENNDVVVRRYRPKQKSPLIITYLCKDKDSEHNDLYWNGDLGAINEGFSPENDALFAGAIIKAMYLSWYGVPVLKQPNGTPMVLNMIVHVPAYDNAYWDGKKMTFGDGKKYFYPLTSLGVAAHEVSHGFTQQHSKLMYYGQSGGMNESFSDMAAQAAEFYAYGKSSWEIGAEISKGEEEALRYMYQPSKDCGKDMPGQHCSIDDASQYKINLDVHYSSGVYNRFFYLLSTSPGWTTKTAFDVMVKANADYWTSLTNFEKGACGVLQAAVDQGQEVNSIKAAFEAVKINITNCNISQLNA